MNRGRSFLLWLVAWQFLAIAGLWLFYDRYVLVLLPLAIALFLTGRPRLRPGPAVALVCLFAAVSIVGLADRVDFDRALWSAVEDLRSRGARESEIDGGYIVNGWLQYAHPENAPRDERGELVVPGLTRADFPLRYTIANRPLPGRRVIGTIPYRQRLRDSGELFLLEIPSRSS
jgi:hypothetical protein